MKVVKKNQNNVLGNNHVVMDLVIFLVIMSILIIMLLVFYLYELQNPYFNVTAQRFYNFLIN